MRPALPSGPAGTDEHGRRSRTRGPRIASVAVLAVMAGWGWVPAQTEVQPTLEQLSRIRQHLAGYEGVAAAEAAGYERFGDCMSGPQGAQGVHFRNPARIDDPTLDPMQPELLMYEPREDGSLRLIGAEYIVFQDAWHAADHEAAPALLGQEFVLNTTLLDEPFYALHLWVWHHNPLGIFANWNPLASCAHGTADAH